MCCAPWAASWTATGGATVRTVAVEARRGTSSTHQALRRLAREGWVCWENSGVLRLAEQPTQIKGERYAARRIKPVSDRRRAESPARDECRRIVLARDRGCVAPAHGAPGECGSPFSDRAPLEVHEVVTRARGGSHLDPENCVALCQTHHDWVTRNPKAATECGLMKPSVYPITESREGTP